MPSDPLSLALQHHRAGDLGKAEAIYRQILSTQPSKADIWLLLGHACQAAGKLVEAIASYRKAIHHRPHLVEAHNNLGVALESQGRREEAADCYQEAVRLKPDYPDALNNLGAALHFFGLHADAEQHCRLAIQHRPDFAQAHNNLGLALAAQGKRREASASFQVAITLQPRYAEARNNLGVLHAADDMHVDAERCYRDALLINANYAEAHNNLGISLKRLGVIEEAVAHFRMALVLRADYPEALNNLGEALEGQNRTEEALASLREALRLKPDFAAALNNTGNVLKKLGRADEAVECYRQALSFAPDFADAHNNLGIALASQGRMEEALASFRLAVRFRPSTTATVVANAENVLPNQGPTEGTSDCNRKVADIDSRQAAIHSNLLLGLHYHCEDPERIFAEHQRWGQMHAKTVVAPVVARTPRRLRIGYVSPDFRVHAVAYFLDFLSFHDRDRFEVFCYSDVERPDEVTERLQRYADHWHSLVGLTNDQAADRVRQDQIDILVDLAGHTGANRLPLFALKPTPIQVTYLGYPDTTGLSTIDYRLTDAFADPEGMTEAYHTERLVRLPCLWCYHPSPSPDVSEPPAVKSGLVTFGSLNNPAKVTPDVIALWSKILGALPGSKLLFKVAPGHRDSPLLEEFGRHGIDNGRIVLIGKVVGRQDFLGYYHDVDICLDPFPYTGVTTTCESLWMGVPVVTLAGRTHVSRQGTSLLSHVGLTDLIADSQYSYFDIAVGLARDLPRLADMRKGLRGRMERSPLMDAKRFARSLEEAYQSMWTTGE